jgi:MYXO-CTERM domain-containing protein
MTNKLFAMFAVTGLSLPGAALADIRDAQITKMIASSETNLAPVTNTNPPRLRRTDEAQAGNEMSHFAFFADGKSGLYFSMSTDLNGVRAPRRMQLAMVPFRLAQEADGSVKAVAEMTGARFVTNNNGNEYRNANHPIAFTAFDGNTICAEYNYQPGNSNDTRRYLQCFDQTGATVLPQTQIYAKNNDDCSMNQDKTSTTVVSKTASQTKLVAWRGCNGNGADDGWAQAYTLTKGNDGRIAFRQTVDVSLCPREERSHGFCSVAASDPNTAICSWTEGNTQPQRDGTWLAAVDISGNRNGQRAILWKQQIEGRKQTPEGYRTYSMRAMHDRILEADSNGELVPSDLIFWRSGDVRGNNNTNGKGGAYMGNQMAIIKATAQGMQYVMPMTNMQQTLLGMDGTHLGMSTALFGTTDKLMPGVVFLGGSHTGGGYSAQMRAVGWDKENNALKDLGMYAVAPYDRHMYPNYLGNNPGNQGRNYAGTEFIKNPFLGENGNKDAYLMVFSTTGKDPEEINMPQRKLSAYLSVIPVAQMPQGSGGGNGGGTGNGDGSGDGSGGGQDPVDDGGEDTGNVDDSTSTTDPGMTLGGCSTTGHTGGLFTLLLVGLAALIRRRK